MINLNYRDPRPIYEQIKDNLRDLIISGAMAKGEKLPSVRELAVTLAINPNTIQRAYKELENEGYAYSIQGKGSFVSDLTWVDHNRIDELLKCFDKTADELKFLGISNETLIQRLRKEDQ